MIGLKIVQEQERPVHLFLPARLIAGGWLDTFPLMEKYSKDQDKTTLPPSGQLPARRFVGQRSLWHLTIIIKDRNY